MRARIARWWLIALALAASPAARADDAMQAAANAFYKVYAAQPRRAGLPDVTARMHYAAVLSPRLDRLLKEAAAAQLRFSTRLKVAAPPLIDGDLFTSNFDGATGWTVGTCAGDAQTARCPVTLSYRAPDRGAGPSKPVQWHDVLVLTRSGGTWKVDDVIYDAAFPQGNTGSLSRMLGMVLAEAPA